MDDVLLYVKPLEEFTRMREILAEEFAKIGLEMHPMKTKLFSSSDALGYDWIDINGMMIEILKKDQSHKYLGRLLNMDV